MTPVYDWSDRENKKVCIGYLGTINGQEWTGRESVTSPEHWRQKDADYLTKHAAGRSDFPSYQDSQQRKLTGRCLTCGATCRKDRCMACFRQSRRSVPVINRCVECLTKLTLSTASRCKRCAKKEHYRLKSVPAA